MNQMKKSQAQISIENAFLDEMDKTPLHKIKIVPLCKAAAVNRSTFYEYYDDVYDLYEKVCAEVIDFLTDRVMSYMNPDSPNHQLGIYDICIVILEETKRHERECRILLKSESSGAFEQKLMWKLLDLLDQRFRKFHIGDNQKFRLDNIMLLGGAIILWKYWVLSNFESSEEEIAETVAARISNRNKRFEV